MRHSKFIVPLMASLMLLLVTGCKRPGSKSNIRHAMREYVQLTLRQGDTYDFIGLSNHRDTLYMGVSRPCIYIIYTVTDGETGKKQRHYDDVILSNDYQVVLNASPLDFDPIEYAGDIVRESISNALNELKTRK